VISRRIAVLRRDRSALAAAKPGPIDLLSAPRATIPARHDHRQYLSLAARPASGGGGGFHYAASRLVSHNVANTKGNGYVEFTRDRVLVLIPEPAGWTTMLAGFGLIGTTMCRRRMAVW
jgi:hypothetical protein